MISLVAPLYLLGMLLIAIPVILHLLRNRPDHAERFPSLFFLRKSLAGRERRNSLRRILVLVFRCLAFVCLALAFAYPVLSDFPLKVRRATVVLVDSSFSVPERERTKVLEELLDEISPEHPMLFASVTSRLRWSGEFTVDRGALERWCAGLEKSAESSSFRSALLAADSRLGSIPARERRIVLVTDGQRIPWNTVDLSRKLRNASVVELRKAAYPSAGGNLALSRVVLREPYTSASETVNAAVTVRNFNPVPKTVHLSFRLDGAEAGETECSVPAGGSVETVFPLVPGKEFRARGGEVRLTVSGGGNANLFAEDDVRYFPLNPEPLPRILLAGRRSEFIPEVLPVQLLQPENRKNAETADLLIFDSLAPEELPDRAGLAERQMKNGGCSVIFWDRSPGCVAMLEHFGFRVRRKILPGIQRLEMIQFDHPVLKDYLKINSGSWFEILFFEVPHLGAPPGTRVLASFGRGIPAILEKRVGAGKLFVFAARPERSRTNWQTFPNFLPFWRELALYSLRPELLPHSLIADGSVRAMPGGGSLTLQTPGNYRFGNTCYSVNVPEQESDPAQFEKMSSVVPSLAAPVRGAAGTDVSEEEILKYAASERSFWRWLLAGALVFFLLEFTLANRTVRG